MNTLRFNKKILNSKKKNWFLKTKKKSGKNKQKIIKKIVIRFKKK